MPLLLFSICGFLFDSAIKIRHLDCYFINNSQRVVEFVGWAILKDSDHVDFNNSFLYLN